MLYFLNIFNKLSIYSAFTSSLIDYQPIPYNS